LELSALNLALILFEKKIPADNLWRRNMSINYKVQEKMKVGSAIRKLFEEGLILKQKYGSENFFDLSIGNPVMESPSAYKEELIRLASSPKPGMHRYMENAGYTETRSAVADQLTLETGINFTGNEVIMSCGTAGALNITLKALLNPGEEIITFAPYYFDYESYTDNHGGIFKIISSDDNFIPRFDLLEEAINPKTKAIIINSPNNPTGIVYNETVLQDLAQILKNKSMEFGSPIYVISDDVYCRIVFDGIKCPRIVNYYPHTIITTSFSKDLALPGERIGYAAVHPQCDQKQDILGALIYATRVLGFVSAPALQQRLVRNLLNVTVPVSEYQRKRDFLYRELTRLGYQIVKPQGAFYLFPRCPVADDKAFLRELKEYNVLAVPGSSFKAPGYFRISYCLDDYTIAGCLSGFQKTMQKFKE
jgi:aspartate aminotransferase